MCQKVLASSRSHGMLELATDFAYLQCAIMGRELQKNTFFVFHEGGKIEPTQI